MLQFAGINIPILRDNLPVRLGGITMTLVAGRAYRIPDKPEIYLYLSYADRVFLRHIPDLETFEAMGRPTVFVIDQATFDATPKGPPFPSVTERPPAPTTLVAGRAYRIPDKPEIYLYLSYADRVFLRHIPDLETFEAMGRPTVFVIDQATFDATPKGPPLPSVKEEPVGPATERRITCPQCSSISTVFLCDVTAPGANCPVSEFPLQNCPVCGYKIVERAKRIEVIQRKPWPPVAEPPWIPTTWPQLPTEILIDYPKIEPLPGIAPFPPTWSSELTTEVVQRRIEKGLPEYRDIEGYSVQERILEAIKEEPWELAEAIPPAPPKKITPYLILAGLAVTTLAVWSYKKKKKPVGVKK